MKLKKPFIVGMIHLPPLPGYPKHPGMKQVIYKAVNDLKALEDGGINAVLIENDQDQPHQVVPGPEIVSAMTRVGQIIRKQSKVPVGVQVLLNHPQSSLAIAHTIGAQFIRTDYFVDKMSRPEYGGEMIINPNELLQYRQNLAAQNIQIWADIQVKHATLLETNKPISVSAQQAEAAGADVIIVTGEITGIAPVLEKVNQAKKAVKNTPIFIGSGLNAQNTVELLSIADGAIVGTALKSGANVNAKLVREIMKQANKAAKVK